MDARELEKAKRRHAKRTWKQLDANPNLTHAEKRCAMFTGYVSESAKQAADDAWERQGATLRRREQEQQRRAMLERAFHARARREGFELVRAEGQLTWERIPRVTLRRADVRRSPRRQRSGARRSARSPGRQQDDDPHDPPELTALQLAILDTVARIEAARCELDWRTFHAFLGVISARVAAEYRRYIEDAA